MCVTKISQLIYHIDLFKTFCKVIILLQQSSLALHELNICRINPTKVDEEELVRDDATSITSSSFNSSQPTKIIIHGFSHSAHTQWVQDMKNELLKYVRTLAPVIQFNYEQLNANTNSTTSFIITQSPDSRVLQYMYCIAITIALYCNTIYVMYSNKVLLLVLLIVANCAVVQLLCFINVYFFVFTPVGTLGGFEVVGWSGRKK